MNLALLAPRVNGHRIGTAILLVVLLAPGCGRRDQLPPENPDRLTIKLRSPAFADGAAIPAAFTCDGSDRSPPLEWSGTPEATRSLALICDDPDAPGGTWSHWVVYNLPAKLKGLREGIPPDEIVNASATEESPALATDVETRQGKNDFGKTGYGGPCPPRGVHRYFFRLYALSANLELKGTPTRADVLKAIQDRILAEGRLMGTYQRGTGK
jgi:Raf kinase inhibitor-like YbhB/YbcL family protein